VRIREEPGSQGGLRRVLASSRVNRSRALPVDILDTVRSVLAGQHAGNHLWLALAELAVVVGVASSLATALFRRRATSA